MLVKLRFKNTLRKMNRESYVKNLMSSNSAMSIIRSYHKKIGYCRGKIVVEDVFDCNNKITIDETPSTHQCDFSCLEKMPTFEEYTKWFPEITSIDMILESFAVVCGADFLLPAGFHYIELYVHLKDLISFGYFPNYGFYLNDAKLQNPYSLRLSIVEENPQFYFYIDSTICTIKGSILTCYTTAANLKVIEDRLHIKPLFRYKRHLIKVAIPVGLNQLSGNGYEYENGTGKYFGSDVYITRSKNVTTISTVDKTDTFENFIKSALEKIEPCEDYAIYSKNNVAVGLVHQAPKKRYNYTKTLCKVLKIKDISKTVDQEWKNSGRTWFRCIAPSKLFRSKFILEKMGITCFDSVNKLNERIISNARIDLEKFEKFQLTKTEYKPYNHDVYKFCELVLMKSEFDATNVKTLLTSLYSNCIRSCNYECKLIYYDATYFDDLNVIPDVDMDVLFSFLERECAWPRKIRLLSVHTPDIYPTREIYYDVLRLYRAYINDVEPTIPEVIQPNKLYIGENREEFIYNGTLFKKTNCPADNNYRASQIKNLSLLDNAPVYVTLGHVYQCTPLH